LTHGYRTLQHWNQWLAQDFLGGCVLDAEQQILTTLLTNHFGKHALLIGVPQQYGLLNTTELPRHALAGPLIQREHATNYIETSLHDLPILTGTVDLVMLPHTLEFVDHPRQLLAEACRVIKPEGLIVITGFNPQSLWGLKKIMMKDKSIPWSGHFIPPRKINSWLRLADFVMEKQQSVLYRPPINHPGVFRHLQFLERVGKICLPMCGGVYILLARAKVIPLTPIRLKWKQQFGIRISSTLPGHIARASK
jgi:SAM-dependent methyltransferase